MSANLIGYCCVMAVVVVVFVLALETLRQDERRDAEYERAREMAERGGYLNECAECGGMWTDNEAEEHDPWCRAEDDLL